LAWLTYFDALNVPDDQLQVDFGNLKNAVHVDGVRIMPSWWAQTSRNSTRTFASSAVMDPGGNIRWTGGTARARARSRPCHVHSLDPGRIVTVSVDHSLAPSDARARADLAGESVVSWHEDRSRRAQHRATIHPLGVVRAIDRVLAVRV
jgi:hypothetical protein